MLSVPINGSSSGRDTTFPNSISFSCDAGFIMIGSQTRRCQSNGIWSGNKTSCRGNILYINTKFDGKMCRYLSAFIICSEKETAMSGNRNQLTFRNRSCLRESILSYLLNSNKVSLYSTKLIICKCFIGIDKFVDIISRLNNKPLFYLEISNIVSLTALGLLKLKKKKKEKTMGYHPGSIIWYIPF